MTTDTNTRSTTLALTALSLPTLMASLDTGIANTALPTLARAFAAPFAAVQWIVLAYLLTITTLIVSAGRLGDRLGRRRLLIAGIALFTLASLACGAASGLGMLLAARAAQGLGAAVMLALSLALVGDTVPRERTGHAMGVLGTMSAIGTASGPSLGGVLIAALGWRSIFLINLPVGVLTLMLVHRHLPADAPRSAAPRAGLDPLGTLLLAGSLAAYALAMTLHRGRAATLALLLAALGGAAMFTRVQARSASPLVPLTLLRDPGRRAGLVMSAIVSTVLMSTLVVGPFDLARALGLPTERVGLLLSVGPLVAALSGIPAGRLADRFGATRTTRTGLAGLALGTLALALLPERLGVAGYLLPIAIVTSNYALFQTSNNALVLSAVDAQRRGTVAGLLNLSRNLGLITGASLMGSVFAFGAGPGGITSAPPAAVAAGMRATFAVSTALVLVALALTRGSARAASSPAVEPLPHA